MHICLTNCIRNTHPRPFIPAKADITNLEEIEQAINTLHKEQEYIDIAIICSGVGDINPTLDYKLERQPLTQILLVGRLSLICSTTSLSVKSTVILLPSLL